MDNNDNPKSVIEDAGQEVETENVETTPEETQEAPMPSAEETAEVTEQDELPETSKDRTREQFEKLTERNKELAKKLEEFERKEKYGNSVLETPRSNQQAPSLDDYSHLSQQQAENIAQDFIDPEGNVDIQGLNNALRNANARAEQAERRANQVAQSVQQAEQQRQLEEAYKEADWLDPSADNFDERRYNLVRDRLTRYYTNGQQPRLVNVVREVLADLGETSKATTQDKKQAVKEYKDKQQAKAQASNVQPSNVRREPNQTMAGRDELVNSTRQGNKTALQDRLKAYENSLK